ncbi:unnamed protein product [Timema podura]|uniref:Uncharacterized protein n=1 Tax=Timema podura TaxID=61482 RepID=A0ABN7NCZ0_TIMPD|nr:unnamed protein product [Timema podura]
MSISASLAFSKPDNSKENLLESMPGLNYRSHYSSRQKITVASQTQHQRCVKGNLLSPLVSRACERCIGTLRDYLDSSTLDHVIANATIK